MTSLPLRRAARSVLALGTVLLLYGSCTDAAGPDGGLIRLSLAPAFAAHASGAAGEDPAALLDNVRLVIGGPGEVALLDTVVLWPVEQDTLRLEIDFDAPPGISEFAYRLEARIAELAVFADDSSFTAFAGTAAVLAPVLEYVGPGANAVALELTAAERIDAGDTLRITAVAREADGGTTGGLPVVWSVLDPAAGSVAADGLVSAGDRLDLELAVVGRVLFTTLADTIRFDVRAAAVRVTAARDTLNALGDTVALSAAALTVAGAAASGAAFTWEALDAGVAALEVSGTGALAIAAATGAARFVVTADDRADTIVIKVVQVPATLALSVESALLTAGDSLRVLAAAADSNGFAIPDPAPALAATDPAVLVPTTDPLTFTAATAAITDLVGTVGPAADTLSIEVVAGPASAIVILADSLTLTALGDSADLDTRVEDDFGNLVEGSPVTWTGGGAFVSVDTAGGVAALAVGLDSVIAAIASAADTVPVRVVQVPATITLLTDAPEVTAGTTVGVSVDVRDANGHVIPDASPTLTTSDTSKLVATSDLEGTWVTGKKAGDVSLFGVAGEVADTLPLTVVAGAPASLVASPESLTLVSRDETFALTATLTDAAGNLLSDPLTWSSSNTLVATVDPATGLVTAVADGTTLVIVQDATLLADTLDVLVAREVASVEILPDPQTGVDTQRVAVGESLTIQAQGFDANGHAIDGVTFTWSVADARTAEVPVEGTLFGLAPGETTLQATATTNGVSGTAPARVTGFYFAVQEQVDGYQIRAYRGNEVDGVVTVPDTAMITDFANESFMPEWKPDGSRIAYAELDVIHVQEPNDLAVPVVANPDFLASDPAWAPDGEQMAFIYTDLETRRDFLATGRVDVDGTTLKVDSAQMELFRQMADELGTNVFMDHPTWSPDSRYIALTAVDTIDNFFSQLMIIDTELQSYELVDAGGLHVYAPDWSPLIDGETSLIAFAGTASFGGATGIHLLDPLQGTVLQLTAAELGEQKNPDWSPNAQRIAYEECGDGGCFDVRVIEPREGAVPYTALSLPFDARGYLPAWGRPTFVLPQ